MTRSPPEPPDGRHPVRRWTVSSPLYEVTDPILEDGSGPTETVQDWRYVEARTKRGALIAGVREMLDEPGTEGWFSWRGGADRDANPFAGVEAELLRCQHVFGRGEEFCDDCSQPFTTDDLAEISGDPR